MNLIIWTSVVLLACGINATPLQHHVEKRADDVGQLQKTLSIVSRSLMMQQFHVEEQTRSNGCSGIKRERLINQGSMPMYTPTYGDSNFASIHNHGNYMDTLGLGELTVVMNGVEFRTRHMDYKMVMKSTTSNKYKSTKKIPMPDVPPEVTDLSTVEDQVAEMKEWFRAFKNQDFSERDYRQYFKPVLCYMEGAWTNSDSDSIDESFPSDRHHLDASTWLNMQQKIRFTSYSGRKDVFENFAYLPTTVMEVDSTDGSVKLAQWNFNVACHPLDTDLPTNRIWPVEDVLVRLTNKLTFEDFVNSRGARFAVSPVNKGKFPEKSYRHVFLDTLMKEIPGMDNYQADLTDEAFGDVAYPFDKTAGTPINAGYYHRWYNSKSKGAGGLGSRHRGYSDENIFMAMTTQSKVAGMTAEDCTSEGICQSWTQKWSYAIPLEIVYLTPLTDWNPYKIKKKGDKKSGAGLSVTGAGAVRNGENSVDLAYDGVHDELLYLTPAEFFNGEVGYDAADTIKDSVYVLDTKGKIRHTSSSGHRVLMNIADVGIIRQRYPIMPIHDEGSTLWKQQEALTHALLWPKTYSFLFHEQADGTPISSSDSSSQSSDTISTGSTAISYTSIVDAAEIELAKSLIKNEGDVVFRTMASTESTGSHVHYMVFSKDDIDSFNRDDGTRVEVTTTEANNHQHDLVIIGSLRADVIKHGIFSCDGVRPNCPDMTDKKVLRVYPEA